MTPFERVVAALEERGLIVSSWGSGKRARCPSHDDKRPSLSVAEGDDGRALVYCFAGCSYADVIDRLGLTVADIFDGTHSGAGTPVAQYIYTDEDGRPLIRVTRTEPKGFYQERMEDGEWKAGLRETRRVLYNLPELVRADEVWIVEGEKDVESLGLEGKVATTCLGGSSNWRDAYGEHLRGKDIIIVGDRDDAGLHYVSTVRLAVSNYARSVRVLETNPLCKDVTEHLQQGFTLDELTEPESDIAEVFGQVDWTTYEVEDTEWLFEPYVPVGGRCLVFGPRGSLKSLWAMWVAAHLSREGKKVAYFSIEMQPSDTVRRIRQTEADPKNLHVFTSGLDLTNKHHIDRMMLGLKGFDLIVVDSWSSVHQLGSQRMSQNDEVAWLDKEVVMPLIEETGATLMMLDNQGWEDPKVKTKDPHVRGASAKEDKQEVCVHLARPKRLDNYTTTLTVTKMRLDHPFPAPVDITTPKDRIEFYEQDGTPHWPGMRVAVEDTTDSDASTAEPTSPPILDSDDGLTPFERRKLARLRDTFGGKKVLRDPCPHCPGNCESPAAHSR